MKTILAVDSTTEILSISISEGSRILSEIKDDKSRQHMVNIIGNLDTAFRNADKSVKDMDLFAINLGPGDFTGGRIGISVIKIFSMLSQKPVIGFNSLDVFSVGCTLKNIKSIAEKKIKSCNVFIMPLIDVRNNEIFFSIYEIKNNKENTKQIYEFEFENSRYHLSKKYGNFILKSEEFGMNFSQIIRQLFLLDDCGCLEFGQIFEIGNLPEGFKSSAKDKDDDGRSEKEILLIMTANGVKSYKLLLEKLKQDIEASHDLIKIMIDEDNINPDSKYLNYLADYSLDNGLESLSISPVYVRDFIAFGKK